MPEVLLVLAVVLVAVTVIGHLIWVTLAWIFRELFGLAERSPVETRVRCPWCSRWTTRSAQRCDWCARLLSGPVPEEMADLAAMERQARRLHEKGLLTRAEADRLIEKADRRRRQLLQPAAEQPFAAAAPAVGPAQAAAASPAQAPVAEPKPKPAPPPAAKPSPARPPAAPARPVVAEAVDRARPESRPAPPAPVRPPAPAEIPSIAVPTEPMPLAKAALKPAAAAQPRLEPAPPPKPWSERLAGFLQERNIHWIELVLLLVGGILLVGPSVALVISLWPQLERIPYLKSFIFVAYSSVVFLAGLYAYRRWKLEATGKALLIVALLLVPLDSLAAASLSRTGWNAVHVATELASLGIFAWLVTLAAGVLVPDGRRSQLLAVVGNSAAVLWLARLPDAWASGFGLLAAGAVPVVIFAVAIGAYLWHVGKGPKLDRSRAEALFALLGTSTFALAVALGPLVAQGLRQTDLAAALDRLSVLVTAAAAVVAAAGLTVVRRVERADWSGGYLAAGTAVALAAIAAMFASVGMAWPEPPLVVAVAALNAVALVWIALQFRLPLAQAAALASALPAYLVGFHWLAGNLAGVPEEMLGKTLLRLAAGGNSGAALVGLAAASASAAGLLAGSGRRRHARYYAVGSLAIAGLSLALVTIDALLHPSGAGVAAIVWAIYAALALAVGALVRRQGLSYLGLGLVAGSTLWTLRWWLGDFGPVWAAVLAAEAAAMGLAAGLLGRLAAAKPSARRLLDVYRRPLLHVAEPMMAAAVAAAVWTAWADRAAIDHTPVPVLTAVLAAAFYLALGAAFGSAARVYAGSAIALAGLVHACVWNYAGLVERPWAVALLAHASLAAVAAAALGAWSTWQRSQESRDRVERTLIRPLGDTAIVSSSLAVPALLVSPWQPMLHAAGLLAWLAAVWLVFAWQRRSREALAAGQIAAALAAMAAATEWLQGRPWVGVLPDGLGDPRSLQVYGIALALTSLGWLVARIALRGNKLSQAILDPEGLSVDRVLRHGVVWTQLAVVAWQLLPHVAAELFGFAGVSATAAAADRATGLAAWTLLGVIALTLSVTLWHRWRASLAGSLLAAATLPWLVAGQFAGQQAVASSLRWGLAACFVVCSAAVWKREELLSGSKRLGAKVDVGPAGPQIARATLLSATVMPLIVVSLAAAVLHLGGGAAGGPAVGSFFARLGPTTSYLVPLALVILALVGHAVRERSAGYAFSAGLVVELAVVLAYVLQIGPPEAAQLATLVQLATIAAAAWGVLWMIGRQKLDVWRETHQRAPASALMNAQLGMAVLGNAALLVPALLAVIFLPDRRHAWSVAAGSWLGWTALVLTVAAMVYRSVQSGRPLRPKAAGLVGMAALGMLALTVQGIAGLESQWAYRTLMLGWAAYAWFVAAATWWAAGQRTLAGAAGPPQVLIRAASTWVVAAGSAAALLGLKAAALHHVPEDLLWAAGAIAAASAAGATMAVWRRREGWALAAGLGVNVAASLVVWYERFQLPLADWGVLLVEVNVIAAAAVALVWLAARRRLYELRELSIGDTPMLAAQTGLGVVGIAALLVPAAGGLLLAPGRPPAWLAEVAQAPGWMALVLALAAAGWYLRQVSPAELIHAVAGFLTGGTVMLACFSANRQPSHFSDPWWPYHVLMTATAAAGLAILAMGRLGQGLRVSGQLSPQGDRPDGGESIFPRPAVAQWVTVLGAAAVALAVLWCRQDPLAPWWSFATIAAASLAAGLLALWQRLPWYVYVSGLLANVAGTIVWMKLGGGDLSGLIAANVLALAAASAVWSLVALIYRPGVPAPTVAGRPLPLANAAVVAGLALLGSLAGSLVLADLAGAEHSAVGRLAWSALGAITLAAGIRPADRSARPPLASFYFAGLTGVGLALAARTLEPQALVWTAGPELAGFVLMAALVSHLLVSLLSRRPQPAGLSAQLSTLNPQPSTLNPQPSTLNPQASTLNRPAAEWFSWSQAVLVAAGSTIALWTSIDAGLDALARPEAAWLTGRMAGPAGFALLLAASFLMAGRCAGLWRAGWQYAAIGLAAVVPAAIGWAWLDAHTPLAWLYRNVILMTAAAASALAAQFGWVRLLPGASDWNERARRSAPVLTAVSLATLATVFVQEAVHYQPGVGTPMHAAAVAAVGAALAALAAVAIGLALLPARDPLGLSDRGRTAYVYAAEGLAVLLGVHLWLTVPELFRLDIIEHYWMLLVMGAAFGTAGLSEMFHRRGMPVLSEPLERTAMLLPLVPATGFLMPAAEGAALAEGPALALAGKSPAVWFLAALFYGILAVNRRSAWLGLLAAVAGNGGLWVLWDRLEIGFWSHPQVWLIPVGLSVLVAEMVHHQRLSSGESTTARYLGLALVYIPSSSEFLRAVGESLWLPLVLITLSVAGVLAGAAFRVRSFMLAGVTFLFVVVVTMIKYAAIDLNHTWVFWVFCIALGTALITGIAFFEKRRADVLAAVKEIRRWQR